MGVFSWFKKISENTLYFPGIVSQEEGLKEIFENYKEIFKILEIEFIVL
jgi:hypothetical protein